MDIFRVIFKNSIIYKIFMYLLFLYDESYLKDVCKVLANIYYGSKVYVGVDKYINSTPLYKHSMIKRVNEKIYLFVVNHTEWLYNFVDRTFTNSFFVKLFQDEVRKAKEDVFKTICGTLGLFFTGIAFGLIFVGKPTTIVMIICVLVFLFLVLYKFNETLKNAFFESSCYKISDKLLKMEVSDETK